MVLNMMGSGKIIKGTGEGFFSFQMVINTMGSEKMEKEMEEECFSM